MSRPLRLLARLGVPALVAVGWTVFIVMKLSEPLPGASGIVSYPQAPGPECRDGRARLYDECSDQTEIYRAAQTRAAAEGKVLLVSYGAEWCIWCHVFAAYLEGEHGAFTHTFSDPRDEERHTETIHERAGRDVSAEAEALKAYAAETFVVVHIDSRHASGGDAVLAASGAEKALGNWIPFIYSVNADGEIAATLDHDRVELRRDSEDWFRGYDRPELLAHLKEMAEAAR